MTSGPGAGPGAPTGTGPFDADGRRIGGRRQARADRSAGAAGTAGGQPPAPGASAPLNWTRSGPLPLRTGGQTLTGGLTFTGGFALGRHQRRKKPTVSGFDPVVRGRGLARLSSRPQPTTASELQRACVRWVVTLWAMVILLQRFSLPSSPIALVMPLSILWCGYGLVRGVLELDRHRVGWWLGAAGVSALIVPVQFAFTPRPLTSMNSWGLLLVTWLVFIFRLRDRRRETYLKALAGLLRVNLWQAALVIGFMGVQFVIPYQDWVAQVVPKSLLLQNYTLAYPFSYGSSIYRSNGWIGLETSFVSIQLALGLIAAVLLRRKLVVILVLLAAEACTGAQSGVQMVAVGVVVILFSPMRWALARYLVLGPTVIAFLVSPLGRNTVVRLTEGTSSKTSTGQRSTVPYELLWPQWIREPLWVMLGRGPGSSQNMIENSGVVGVIVPSPVKLFFDYGVIAGLALAVFLMFMYLGGPSRAMALAMGSSYWIFNPGTTSILLVISIPLFVTWWTPRGYKMLEGDFVPSPNANLPQVPTNLPRSEFVT